MGAWRGAWHENGGSLKGWDPSQVQFIHYINSLPIVGDQEGKHQIHHWSLREWLKILCSTLNTIFQHDDPDDPDTDHSWKLYSSFERREVAQHILDFYKCILEYADSPGLPGKLGVYWRPKDGRAESRRQLRNSSPMSSPGSRSKWWSLVIAVPLTRASCLIWLKEGYWGFILYLANFACRTTVSWFIYVQKIVDKNHLGD